MVVILRETDAASLLPPETGYAEALGNHSTRLSLTPTMIMKRASSMSVLNANETDNEGSKTPIGLRGRAVSTEHLSRVVKSTETSHKPTFPFLNPS